MTNLFQKNDLINAHTADIGDDDLRVLIFVKILLLFTLSIDSYSSENCQSFRREYSSFTDDTVNKNCSADARGMSGYARRSSSIRAFSSGVGSNGNNRCCGHERNAHL